MFLLFLHSRHFCKWNLNWEYFKGDILKKSLSLDATSIDFLTKRCSKNMQQIYWRTPCWSVISIKLQNNFIEISFWHRCLPVNLLHIFRIPFPKNNSGQLLLYLFLCYYVTLLCSQLNEINGTSFATEV